MTDQIDSSGTDSPKPTENTHADLPSQAESPASDSPGMVERPGTGFPGALKNAVSSLPHRWRASPGAIAPSLALVGLLIVGLATFQVYRTFTPTLPNQETPTPTASPTPAVTVAPGQTPTPAPTATVRGEVSIPGQLVYAKNGAIWIQDGNTARQLTQPVNGSTASQPAFSPDGQWIYYIDTRPSGLGSWPLGFHYVLNVPVLCRIHPDGSGREDLLSGLIKRGSLKVYYILRQPSINTISSYALVASDGPTGPGVQDVMIHLVDLSKHKLSAALRLPEDSPLGLSDPDFAPDGVTFAYTMEGRAGSQAKPRGAPSVWIGSIKGGTPRRLATNTRDPAWSPDGKYIAATSVSGDAMNVVVLDATTGKNLGQVTTDGMSWAPTWSPDGDKLIYLHMNGSSVELNMVYISNSGTAMTFRIEPNLVDLSGLDGASPPSWYIQGYGYTPPPAATPTPATTPTPAAS
jgi:hypothetical protein